LATYIIIRKTEVMWWEHIWIYSDNWNVPAVVFCDSVDPSLQRQN